VQLDLPHARRIEPFLATQHLERGERRMAGTPARKRLDAHLRDSPEAAELARILRQIPFIEEAEIPERSLERIVWSGEPRPDQIVGRDRGAGGYCDLQRQRDGSL